MDYTRLLLSIQDWFRWDIYSSGQANGIQGAIYNFSLLQSGY